MPRATKTPDTGTPAPEPRRRDPLRRERILAAAANLFAARGYDRTGMNDIGAAAGITGPAVYRHFRGKDEVLVALFERLVDRLQRETVAALDAEAPALERLRRLVAATVRVGLDDLDVLSLTARDLQTVTPEARGRISAEQAKLRASWVRLLAECRPELSAREARALTAIIPGLVTSVSMGSELPRPRLETMLERMLLAALLADLDEPEHPRRKRR